MYIFFLLNEGFFWMPKDCLSFLPSLTLLSFPHRKAILGKNRIVLTSMEEKNEKFVPMSK